jgi:ABC-type bacteriocin/lantibiotic exporter with double-glycine peptidase domain
MWTGDLLRSEQVFVFVHTCVLVFSGAEQVFVCLVTLVPFIFVRNKFFKIFVFRMNKNLSEQARKSLVSEQINNHIYLVQNKKSNFF